MDPLLMFVLFMVFIALPLGVAVNWFRYRGTIIFKTALAILATNLLVGVASFMIGQHGIKYILWYVPAGYFILLVGNLIFKRFVQKPINSSIKVLDKISKGDLNVQINESIKNTKDEIGQLNLSLEELILNLKVTAEFARQVGEGNLDHEIELLSDSDHLRIALLEMRSKLKEAVRLQEEKHTEEEKRSWANEGLAKLNEILRKQDDVAELSYQILSYLINYMNANQGGIFIRNHKDENVQTLELKSFYAFNRRKYIKKSFEFGEGLVGNCALEKQTIHLTEIPDKYIQITSGLGGSNPNSLLLVPMKMENEVLGVIEIASFSTFEKYQIEFLEQASLSVASSLNMAETNKRTTELLTRTQQQAEEMAAQEEEMRQNMEELQATQEESSRRAEESEMQLIELQDTNDDLDRELKKALKKIEELESKVKKK